MTDSLAHHLAEHPRRDDLAVLVRTLAFTAADERVRRLGDGLGELLRDAELGPSDGTVADVDVLGVLTRLADPGDARSPSDREREAITRLLGRGIALLPDEERRDGAAIARRLLWLGTHTFVDAFAGLDDALGSEAEPVWDAVAARVRALDEAGLREGRGEALLGLTALRASGASAASAACGALSERLGDGLLRSLLDARPGEPESDERVTGPPARASAPSADASVEGRMVPPPLGPTALLLWCVSGLILVRYALRFVGSVLLRCRRPAGLSVTGSGVAIKSRVEVLGRTVRSGELLIPYANLARASREVRYPRLAMYAGLLMLAVGTYLGVSLATDGARAGSPFLLAVGAAVFGAGVLCDLVLQSLWRGRRGECLLLLVPRRGAQVALVTGDEQASDRVLRAVAARAAAPRNLAPGSSIR